jgi:hypothetical protein
LWISGTVIIWAVSSRPGEKHLSISSLFRKYQLESGKVRRKGRQPTQGVMRKLPFWGKGDITLGTCLKILLSKGQRIGLLAETGGGGAM